MTALRPAAHVDVSLVGLQMCTLLADLARFRRVPAPPIISFTSLCAVLCRITTQNGQIILPLIDSCAESATGADGHGTASWTDSLYISLFLDHPVGEHARLQPNLSWLLKQRLGSSGGVFRLSWQITCVYISGVILSVCLSTVQEDHLQN